MRSHVNSPFVSISSSGSFPMVEIKKGGNTTRISTGYEPGLTLTNSQTDTMFQNSTDTTYSDKRLSVLS